MDKTIRPVDDIIAKARSGGRAKQGKFSLDACVAKEKLKDFRLEDPFSIGVELFRAAVLKGATWVEMHAAPTYFWMKFDGRGYEDDEFKSMYDYYFSGEDADAEQRAIGQLALALNASAALGPEQIEVLSGNGSKGVRLVIEENRDDRIEPLEEIPSDTEIFVRLDGSPIGETGANRIAKLLKVHCRHSDVELLINGEPCAFGFRLDGDGKRIPFELDTLQGLAGRDRTIDRGEIRFLKDGITVETQFLPQKYLGVAVLVSDSRFRTDLSSRKIVRDEIFKRAVREATAAAESVRGSRKKMTPDTPAPRVASKSEKNDAATVVNRPSGTPPSDVPTTVNRAADTSSSESAWLALTMPLAILLIAPLLIAWATDSDFGAFQWGLFSIGILLFIVRTVLKKSIDNSEQGSDTPSDS